MCLLYVVYQILTTSTFSLWQDELSDTEKAEIEVEELEPIKDEDLLILQENGDGVCEL